ncbi:hypothetical protein RRG08_000018 [Elysia crispata]|uniref:Uncharacterized protein n=1 Tax=Elysia crispata TaxID=231223 RepID=A0AAE1CT56_9GAST|nr:hypothetical protein RRG08_000018 [Elysia crispata]
MLLCYSSKPVCPSCSDTAPVLYVRADLIQLQAYVSELL